LCAAFGYIALAGVLAGTACGVLSPEEQLLTEFFEASKVYDTSVMARLSAKPLNPRTDGVIETFEIERIDRLEGGRKVVTVAARVRRFDGQRASRQLVMTLTSRGGRWQIEDFR
jgi:hypothetical protein